MSSTEEELFTWDEEHLEIHNKYMKDKETCDLEHPNITEFEYKLPTGIEFEWNTIVINTKN